MTTLTPSSEIRVATRQAGGFYALKSTEEDIVASRDHFTTHIVLEEKSALAGRRDISTSRRRQPGFTIRGEAEPPSRSTNGSNPHSNFTSEPGTVAWTTTAPKFSAPCSPTSYSFATTAENTNTTAQFAGSSTASEFPDPLELAQPCSSRFSNRHQHPARARLSRSVSAVAPEFSDTLTSTGARAATATAGTGARPPPALVARGSAC